MARNIFQRKEISSIAFAARVCANDRVGTSKKNVQLSDSARKEFEEFSERLGYKEGRAMDAAILLLIHSPPWLRDVALSGEIETLRKCLRSQDAMLEPSDIEAVVSKMIPDSPKSGRRKKGA